ncbi:MAG TPA: hypothetical protein VGP82_05240 [Ktedonobacterales bacterium]|nr:hypothetical protein [Ktedonobacterales bacterium]
MQVTPRDDSATATAATQDQGQSVPAEARQFDFWLGEWDLTWEGGSGTNCITRIFDGQVIQERFAAHRDDPNVPPLQGLSVSVFDSALGKWRQTWVDNNGSYMDFVGGFSDGKMALYMDRTMNGKASTYCMVFYNIAGNSLDWDWERSEDGGQSWQLQWRIHYRRRES